MKGQKVMFSHAQLYGFLVAAAFLSGFFYGRSAAGRQDFKNAVIAFQMRERINHAVDKSDAVELCAALGGVRAHCAAKLRGLGKSAENQ